MADLSDNANWGAAGGSSGLYESPTEQQIQESGELPIIDTNQLAEQQTGNIVSGAVDTVKNTAGAIHGFITGDKHKDLYAWRDMPPGPEREAARDSYFQKYYGGSYEQYKDYNLLEKLGAGWKNDAMTSTSLGGAVGLSLLDLPMDLVGLLPGGAKIDDGWDRATAYSNPGLQSVRNLAGIVIPTLMGTGAISKGLTTMNASTRVPWVTKALTNVGAYSALDAAIIGVSDQGEEDTAARALVDFFPNVFGPDGSVPLPEFIVTLDGDSPAVRREKNIWESSMIALPTNLLGYYLQAGKPLLKWFKPLDKVSDQYKNAAISTAADDDLLIRIQEVDQILKGKVSKEERNILFAQRQELVDKAKSHGDLEDYIKNAETSKLRENDIAGEQKLANNHDPELDVDPDVNPTFYNDGNRARQSVPPGNVARNMADTTAIKKGDVVGSPAPLITQSMKKRALRVNNTSREIVEEVAKQARDTGNFGALVDGVAYNRKQMGEEAWKIYRSIIHADSLDEVKNLFLSNKRTLELAETVFANIEAGGKFAGIVAENEATGGALAALKDLTDRYIGQGIMQSSARVMDTLGRETADMSRAIRELAPNVDEDRVTGLILEKMEYLMQEVGLNKYIKGWQVKQYDRWYSMLEAADDPNAVLQTLKEEFLEFETRNATKSQKWIQELRRLQDENPAALRPLIQAFENTNGDVDTLEKLMIWARNEVTPMGLLASPTPNQLNKFAQGLWAVGYNNILSGLAAGRAILGNTYGIISKPLVAFGGATIEGITKGGDWNKLKRSMYYYGGVGETNRRILKESWTAMKKVWKDPDAMIAARRTDMLQANTVDWDVLEGVREQWLQEGNWGRVFQHDAARQLYDLSRWAPMRIGMTVLQGADAGLNAAMATYLSRLRAYDDVFTKAGKTDFESLLKAEKKNYSKYFDKNGVLTDEASKVISGEYALNLKDDLSDDINRIVSRYPFMKTLFMFPRTVSNNLKLMASWTPIAAIPGLSKYGDTIWAETPEQIAKAMKRHGLDIDRTPNAMEIFENLRTEYKGRLAFSGMLAGGMYSHAMSGNIRGNGSFDPAQRRVDRDQFGFQSKTIKIGDTWVSFKGIPMIDPMLTMLGDMAYYSRDLSSPIMEDTVQKLTWTISATFLNESVLTGLEPLVAMLNSDLSWFSRYAANTTRIFLPMSGAAGVLSKAIDSTQKDIHDNITHYILNRTPILSTGLPKQVDIYTGEYLNDIDNPILRILNALSPIQVSGTAEWWRTELRDTGYDGLSILKRHSSGDYEYTASEREYMNRLVGEQQIYKKIEKILKSPKYKDQIGKLRAHRATGDDLNYDRVTIDGQRLPVFREIDRIVREAQLNAELIMEQERPDILESVQQQQLLDNYMEQGRIDDARGVAEENQDMVELLQMAK